MRPEPKAALVLGALSALLMGEGECGTDQDGDGFTEQAGDCDDRDPAVHPGAAEVCDGVDNDCDDQVDEGYTTRWYTDQDGDGYGDPGGEVVSCDQPAGMVSQGGDCDDEDKEVHPAGLEICNGQDDNCDGAVDEGTSWFVDRDGDGFGSDPACETGDGTVQARGDCDDRDPAIHPGAEDAVADGVDQDCGGTAGPDPHVGLSSSSYTSVAAALAVASPGQTVWVGPGTYPVADLSFRGLALRLVSTHLAAYTVLDAGGAGAVLVFDSGEPREALVDGFTLTGGRASQGGGVVLIESSPTLRGCVVEENQAENGGGLYLDHADPLISHCTVRRNVATDPHFGGGGAYLEDARPQISHVLFSDNEASTSGGGLYLADADPLLAHCSVLSNSAGGWYDEGGGGLFMDGASPHLVDTQVADNVATNASGGGMLLRYSSDATVESSTIVDNRAAEGGGGVYAVGSNPTFSNITVLGNIAATGGGLLLQAGYSDEHVSIVNAILAFNSSYNLVVDPDLAARLTLRYSDLFSPEGEENHNLDGLDTTNETIEPHFMRYTRNGDPTDDDLHLPPGDPLVDAGDPGLLDPDGSRSDMGAYGGPACAWAYYEDADGDGMYDGWETAHGLYTTVDDSAWDPDGDGLVNEAEFQLGTDPNDADTDGDGYDDPTEVEAGTDPNDFGDNPGPGGPVTVVVPDDFGSMEAAAAAVPDGSTILVEGGTWPTCLEIQGKDLTIEALDPDDPPILSGDGCGVLAVDSATVALRHLVLKGGHSGNGAGIEARSAHIVLEDITIRSQYAENLGGAIYLQDAVLQADGLTLEDCHAVAGGGIYAEGAVVTVASAVLEDLVSETSGAGLYLRDSDATLEQAVVRSNRAGSAGAGIYLVGGSVLAIENSVVAGNEAAGDGGGLYVWDSSVSMTQTTVVGNRARLGGGILQYQNDEALVVESSILAFNSAGNLHVRNDPDMVTVRYSVLHVPWGENHNLETLETTVREVDPGFVAYTPDLDPADDDYHLRPSSPVRDIAPGQDPDGSAADPGAYGGPDADWSYYEDEDGDALPDGWEERFGVTTSATGPGQDLDGDGLDNRGEMDAGTDPADPDSDGDGFADGAEVSAGADPLDWFERPGQTDPATALVPGDFSTVDAAIQAMGPGGSGTVQLAGDSLAAGTRFAWKQVQLAGAASGTTLRGSGAPVLEAWSSLVSLEDLLFVDTASSQGAVSLAWCEVSLHDLQFRDNEGGGAGGALRADHTTFAGDHLVVSGNQAASLGGGLYLASCSGTLDNLAVTSNVSGHAGGGLYLDGGDIVVSHAVVAGNVSGQGGGVYIGGAPTLSHAWISTNAGTEGGGIYVAGSPRLSHVVVTGNSGTTTGGVFVNGSSSAPWLDHAIVAYNQGWNLSGEGTSFLDPPDPVVTYTCLYNLPGQENYSLLFDTTTLYTVDPGFLEDTTGGVPTDVHLKKTSRLVDAGDPDLTDRDGTVADPGIYGGDGGDGWDLDNDGVPDYFWPGTLDDAPAGFSPDAYDPDDLDPTVP